MLKDNNYIISEVSAKTSLNINTLFYKDIHDAIMYKYKIGAVENKEKVNYLNEFYTKIKRSNFFNQVISTYNNSLAMQEVNDMLEEFNKLGQLNNSNITRMVKNYFWTDILTYK